MVMRSVFLGIEVSRDDVSKGRNRDQMLYSVDFRCVFVEIVGMQ